MNDYFNQIKTNHHLKPSNNTFIKLSAGMVAGFVSQYVVFFLEDLFNIETYNAYQQTKRYIARIISGGLGAMLISKTGLLPLMILTTGIYYGVTEAADEITGVTGEDIEERIKFFLIDVFFLYFIFKIRAEYLKRYGGKDEVKPSDKLTFNELLSISFKNGIIISVYFTIRQSIRLKLEEKEKYS